jgi:hypothetical protein
LSLLLKITSHLQGAWGGEKVEGKKEEKETRTAAVLGPIKSHRPSDAMMRY